MANAVSERRTSVRVGWQGRVKEIAKNWTLMERYGKLVEKHSEELRVQPNNGGRPSSGMTSGEIALTLQKLALDYDERSWFAGYAAKTLSFRKVDAFRRDMRDPMVEALPLGQALVDQESGTVEESTDEQVAAIGDPADESATGLFAAEFRWSLEKLLDSRQRRILAMKIDEDLPDRQIGKRLGLTRETVNREWAKIRSLGASLRVP